MGKILLFDIDNTLLFTGGAGSHAFNRAFYEIYGIEQAFTGISFAGRTDRAILRDGMVKHGIIGEDPAEFDAAVVRFQSLYFELVEESLASLKGGAVLPGVVDLLDELSKRPGMFIGLATGNFRRSAFAKLDYYGIAHYFIEGGFADDAEDRGELVAAAARRMRSHPAVPDGDHQVFVFGDTPHDIRAATVNGFRAVGVATGGSRVDDLKQAGADHVFADFSATREVVAVLDGTARRPGS